MAARSSTFPGQCRGNGARVKQSVEGEMLSLMKPESLAEAMPEGLVVQRQRSFNTHARDKRDGG